MTYIIKNNNLMLKEDLHISMDDRSFRFGDGCFETLIFQHKYILHFEDHIDRLKYSLKQLKIPLNLDKIKEQADTLFIKNNIESGILRIICSRGSGSVGYLPYESHPYYILETVPKPSIEIKKNKLYLSSFRRFSSDQFPTQGKINNALQSILSRMEAQENQCFEALLLNSKNQICEGSSSAIFWTKHNTMYIPQSENYVLPSITLKIIHTNYPGEKIFGLFDLDDLKKATHVYICNSVWGVIPVEEISPLNMKFSTNSHDEILLSYSSYLKSYFEG